MKRYILPSLLFLFFASQATGQIVSNGNSSSGGGGGSGTVSSGTAGQIATYQASGTTVAGTGPVTGAVKVNGSGVASQAACADLSNAAASCSTDTTNAANISSGTLALARGGTASASGNNSSTIPPWLRYIGNAESGAFSDSNQTLTPGAYYYSGNCTLTSSHTITVSGGGVQGQAILIIGCAGNIDIEGTITNSANSQGTANVGACGGSGGGGGGGSTAGNGAAGSVIASSSALFNYAAGGTAGTSGGTPTGGGNGNTISTPGLNMFSSFFNPTGNAGTGAANIGGGGGGSGGNGGPSGGRAGGVVALVAGGTLTLGSASVVNVSGAAGTAGGANQGGGGGGGGGCVFLVGTSVTKTSGFAVTLTGGSGGNAGSSGAAGGTGGTGSEKDYTY